MVRERLDFNEMHINISRFCIFRVEATNMWGLIVGLTLFAVVNADIVHNTLWHSITPTETAGWYSSHTNIDGGVKSLASTNQYCNYYTLLQPVFKGFIKSSSLPFNYFGCNMCYANNDYIILHDDECTISSSLGDNCPRRPYNSSYRDFADPYSHGRVPGNILEHDLSQSALTTRRFRPHI